MKASLLLCLAVASALPSFGQDSARTLTRRVAPQTPQPNTAAGQQPRINQAVPQQPAAPADPAKVAAEKQKTESDVIKYYKGRAESGSDSAQYELGLRYMTGNGIEKDEKLGQEWMQKSAKTGNIKALRKLEELGIPLDKTKPADEKK